MDRYTDQREQAAGIARDIHAERYRTSLYRVDFEARPVLLEVQGWRHSYVVESDTLPGAVFAARQLAAKRGLVTTRILHAAPIDPEAASDWGKLS